MTFLNDCWQVLKFLAVFCGSMAIPVVLLFATLAIDRKAGPLVAAMFFLFSLSLMFGLIGCTYDRWQRRRR